MRRILPLLVLCWSLVWATLAAGAVRVYTPKHRSAVELLPVLQPLLAPDEKASVSDGQLVVRGSEAALADFDLLVTRLDHPAELLRITLRQTDTPGIRATGRPGQPPPRVLGNVGRTVEQTLVVASGESGFLTVGKDIPYDQDLALFTGDTQGLTRHLAWKRVTTGFAVTAQRLGDNAQLTLTPEMADAEAGADAPSVAFQQARTTLTVPLRTWVTIGHALTGGGSFEQGAVGLQTGPEIDSRALQIQVEPLP